MTIKDIAQLAGVSTSTISKIINQKDDSISAATRERVLSIIKEYNYTPYSAVTMQRNHKTLLLGLILRELKSESFIKGMIQTAAKQGYTVIVCESNGSLETEFKNISTLTRHNVDGIFWEPVSPDSLAYATYLEKIPYQIFNTSFSANAFNLDHGIAGYYATQILIQKEHREIACILANDTNSEQFLKGYRKCLFNFQIPFDESKVFHTIEDTLIRKITNRQISAVITADYAIMLTLYELLQQLHFTVPADISLLSLREDGADLSYPHISTITIPHYEYGASLCLSMVEHIEQNQEISTYYPANFPLADMNTVAPPYDAGNQKILVVGNANIDSYMKSEILPAVGKSTITTGFYTFPGGKGINEAVGIAKLGGKAALISAVGNDVESESILLSLNEHDVDTQGVYRAPDAVTGKAYIFLNRLGESMISILPGANQMISGSIIKRQEHLFDNIAYCLISTEIPMEAVLSAAKLARKHKAKIIVKPAACSHLPNELLKHVDILVPNLFEINVLCPKLDSLEAQADYFLGKGVETVIVTLGAEGCFLKTKKTARYFKAADFQALDETGAADAFIAALAVYLQKKYSITDAIRIATYAAGFSVSREGVVPALIDTNTLESYIRLREPKLLGS